VNFVSAIIILIIIHFQELPKVEDKIKKLIHSREEVNGEPFLLNGRRASLVLNEQWEAKRFQKEADKQSKVIEN